jgi:hypothetical protein
MKDKEIRATVLQKLYDNRQEIGLTLKASLFEGVSEADILRIILQLSEYGMIEYYGASEGGHFVRLLASGVDAVEADGAGSLLDLSFPITQHITHIAHSSNIQVGDHNTQSIVTGIQQLISEIDCSSSSDEQKKEAKSLLKGFLEHPLTSAVVGGAVGGLVGMLKQ